MGLTNKDKMTKNYRITVVVSQLGTKPKTVDLLGTWLAGMLPEAKLPEDERAAGEAVEKRVAQKEDQAQTLFHCEDGVPGIYDYQIKGFFKAAASASNRFDKEFRGGLEKLSAFKTKICNCIFVKPRFIKFKLPEGAALGYCVRPLIADTPQGQITTLVKSEEVPVGSTLDFEVIILDSGLAPYVNLWMDYGKLSGLGQWRNSGHGRFRADEIDKDGKIIAVRSALPDLAA